MSDITFDPLAAHELTQAKGFRLTRGHRLLCPVTIQNLTPGERRRIYYRHGLTREAHQWLLSVLGATTSYADWEFNASTQARWLYTGSQITSRGTQCLISLWFRDKSDALLFKLAWTGRL